MFIQKHPIILASKSPRRQELLKGLGLDFTIELKDVDESYPAGLNPADIAVYISNQKALAFSASKDTIVITADTIVALHNEILGKPKDKEEAVEMLRKLSGGIHQVYTGVTVNFNRSVYSFYDLTTVHCSTLNEEEIDFYIENYKPFDKAGSYGVQDWFGLAKVEKLEGSYTNVMGLPTEKLYQLLQKLA
ncbi:Maf family protein [Pedobacter sp.]|uniref:Maf family protein n=1 Tax=Pedobacter sp. TaxID=1411316 RepID=UPI00396CE91A